MTRERLGTGLAAAALGTLVLVMVLLVGWLGAGRPGGLFGPAPADGGARVGLVDPGVALPGAPPAPAEVPAPPAETTPPLPDAGPAPVTDGPTGDPAPPPGPEPEPAPSPVPVPGEDEPDGGLGGTLESVGALAGATVGAVASTLGDTVAAVFALLSGPPDDASVTATAGPSGDTETGGTETGKTDAGDTATGGTATGAEDGETGQDPEPPTTPAGAAGTPGADPDATSGRGRGLPTTPRIPELPR